MAVFKTGSISSETAGEVQSRVYQIKDEVSRIISRLPLEKAEDLLRYCREYGDRAQ
jgi:hypothetical protein